MRSARRRKTHPSTRTAFELLEPRAMLAGLGPDSFSVLGSTTAVLLPGVSSPVGIVLTCGRPTPGSASGTGDSQSTGLALPSNSGSGTGSSSAGSSGTSNSGGLMLPSNSGSGAGSSSIGSSSGSNSGVLTLPSGAGSGTGSSTSGATGGSTVNGAAPPQGNGTEDTLSNADLWRMYWSGAGAVSSSSGSDEGSLVDDPTISAQYTGGSGIGRITPLVYNPQNDGPPVFVSGLWTGNEGEVQFVQAAGQGGGQSLRAAGSAFGRSVGMSIYSIGQSYYGAGQYITGNTAGANDTWNSAYNNGPIGQAEQIGPGTLAWTKGGLYVAAGSMVAAGGAAAWTTAGWPTFSVGLNTTTGWHVFFGVTANGKINLLHYAEGMGVTGAPSFLAAEARLLVAGLPIFYPNFAINSTAGSNCVNSTFYAYAQGLGGGLSLIPPWAWPVIP